MDTAQQAETARLKDRAYSHKEVVEIIHSVLGSIDKNAEPTSKLHSELTALASYIGNTRLELAQLRSIELSHNHIPAATDELDAVIGETARATVTIMDACDKIQEIAGDVPASIGAEINGVVTSIYEACSFQDITGQRITKVVKTLKHIEAKVSEIINAFGHTQPETPGASASPRDKLLNGPQLRGSTQEDIDKLLASFGK